MTGIYRRPLCYRMQGVGHLARMVLVIGIWASGQAFSAPNNIIKGSLLKQPSGLDVAGVYKAREMYPELQGQGVRFAVISRSLNYLDDRPQNDYQPNVAHDCLEPNHFQMWDDGVGASVSTHATGVCSILFGREEAAYHPGLGSFQYEGIVPQAQAEVFELWYAIDVITSGLSLDADVVNISSGIDFEDWWTRSMERQAEQKGIVLVGSIGNGTESYHPVLYPGAAANAIGVGVVDSVKSTDPFTNTTVFSFARPEHSSCGPTSDGRCKPDLVAPGNVLTARGDDPNGYRLTGNWSSFATPVVSGIAGMMIQKARQDPNLVAAVSPETGGCVLKAVLMNSANKLPYWHKGRLSLDDDHTVPLDYAQGAGMVDAVGAFAQLAAGRQGAGQVYSQGWDWDRLGSDGAGKDYQIHIDNPVDQILTVTLVWNRHYPDIFDMNSVQHGDLRLELWAVDPEDPDRDWLLDYSDSKVDNVEHLYSQLDPNYTEYELLISINDDKPASREALSQAYAVAWNVEAKFDNTQISWYDLNADGVVDESDCAALIENWMTSLKSQQAYTIGDVNTDGLIDNKDLRIIINHINRKADWYVQ